MGTISIFRLTLSTDDENTGDRIDFNTNNKTNVENAIITGIEFNPTDGVGNNQGAEQDLGDQQALGLLEDVIKISGFVSKRNGAFNDGFNSFLAIFNIWTNEPKINDNWDWDAYGKNGKQPLLHVLMHELLHTLGLLHDSNHPESIMYPYASGKIHFSKRDLQRLWNKYGKRILSNRIINYFKERRTREFTK